MKYLTACLSLMVTSAWANEDLRACLADTEMNPGNRFTHEVINTDAGDYKVVNDAATDLQWSYCFIGQTLSSDQMSCEGVPTVAMDLFPERKFYPNVREKTLEIVEAENQRLGESNHLWHLPNMKDLLTIYNERCVPATYPMFSYNIDLTTEEIIALKDTEFDWDWPENEKAIASEKRFRGQAYHSLRVSTDSNLLGDYLFFYTVSFNGHSSPLRAHSNNYSMMRLVRKKPQQ
ncbi:hypothetical protein [Vibrio nigripulchritudo]|uniref:hypothetical protein n=1 Tax=Vibrio nigripulchritudo TaxID=28173 RepID=UPI0003B1DAFF|nr:hypothetical protein [Vibrio nigripulchritudo]CCN81194.1 conserved hypothetical protein [Vibrio nigripulchritudo BLFn1]CCO53564.1 conserved hypothetical protein [Vibrio nigripulchritudo Wn13]